MRDGTLLYADVFRPDGGSRALPVDHEHRRRIMKDKLWVPPRGPRGEAPNPLHELGDRQSAVVVSARLRLRARRRRGSGKSPGKSEPSSLQEARRHLRLHRVDRETALVQRQRRHAGHLVPRQFPVARRGLKPPSLKAIMPWEGRADQYRDQAYHGGIFAMGFIAQLVAHADRASSARESRAATTRTRSTTICCGSTCATTSIPSTGA